MSILDLQIGLTQERLSALRKRRKNALRKKRAARPQNGMRTYELQFCRAKRGCTLRWRGLRYKEIAAVLEVSVSRARELARRGFRYFISRRSVPAIHNLQGKDWKATNCNYKWSHPLPHRQIYIDNRDPVFRGY